MKKIRIILASAAIICGILTSYGFKPSSPKLLQAWFRLNQSSGPYSPPLEMLPGNPVNNGNRYVCEYWENKYCAGKYNLNSSGQPVGPPVEVVMGEYVELAP